MLNSLKYLRAKFGNGFFGCRKLPLLWGERDDPRGDGIKAGDFTCRAEVLGFFGVHKSAHQQNKCNVESKHFCFTTLICCFQYIKDRSVDRLLCSFHSAVQNPYLSVCKDQHKSRQRQQQPASVDDWWCWWRRSGNLELTESMKAGICKE